MSYPINLKEIGSQIREKVDLWEGTQADLARRLVEPFGYKSASSAYGFLYSLYAGEIPKSFYALTDQEEVQEKIRRGFHRMSFTIEMLEVEAQDDMVLSLQEAHFDYKIIEKRKGRREFLPRQIVVSDYFTYPADRLHLSGLFRDVYLKLDPDDRKNIEKAMRNLGAKGRSVEKLLGSLGQVERNAFKRIIRERVRCL